MTRAFRRRIELLEQRIGIEGCTCRDRGVVVKFDPTARRDDAVRGVESVCPVHHRRTGRVVIVSHDARDLRI